MKHLEPHPQAGQTVVLDQPINLHGGKTEPGTEFRLEDYWDRVSGGSWTTARGNPACLEYALRSAFARLPLDDEVVYGKIGAFGVLVHVSELS